MPLPLAISEHQLGFFSREAGINMICACFGNITVSGDGTMESKYISGPHVCRRLVTALSFWTTGLQISQLW